jgi:hypothetical protein
MFEKIKDKIVYQAKYNYYKLFYAKPDAVITFGTALGDDLLCTIIAKQLKEKGFKNIWIKTFFPEMFLNNPDISRVITKKGKYDHADWEIERFIDGCHIVAPHYTTYHPETDSDEIPSKHIIELMCDSAGVDYPETMKPFIFLDEKEKHAGKMFENQVCIQSGGAAARNYMKNKEWFPDRFIEVVEQLKQQYNIIQIGTKQDNLLPGVTDMRGKTTIRETAALLHNSKFFVGLVGFLMHLSRAVDCKGVIIFGGRESPSQTGYDFNTNLYSPVHCSPCWLRNNCHYDRMCMKAIQPAEVAAAALSIAAPV